MTSHSESILQRLNEVDWQRYDGQEAKVVIGHLLLVFQLGVGVDLANPLRPPAPDRGFPTVRGSLMVKVPYDLANIDRETTGLQLASLGVVLTSVFLLLAIMSSPLSLLVDSLASSTRQTHTVDEAFRKLPWAKLLKTLDLEEGWAALNTPANCRRKVVCEVHGLLRRASPHTLRLVKAFVPHLKGTSQYRGAAAAGLGGRDCGALYPECGASGLQFLTNLPDPIMPTDPRWDDRG
ncbi:uncharacterized protein LOC122247775 [Penaeus japonicus]|uniref:uncharacterized protein LOC122247775 n=1 Tax=Penaeus japonicus TaxID=27405 RepID=UPI001C70EEE0|nr:uncharacterized protein LOC122247775 [Penaeus japonicus]